MRGCARQELQILSTHFSSGKVWRKGSGDAFYWRGKGEALIFLHGASPAARSSPLICRAKQQRGPFSPSETCICLFVLCEGLKPPHTLPARLGWAYHKANGASTKEGYRSQCSCMAKVGLSQKMPPDPPLARSSEGTASPWNSHWTRNQELSNVGQAGNGAALMVCAASE